MGAHLGIWTAPSCAELTDCSCHSNIWYTFKMFYTAAASELKPARLAQC